MTGCFQGRKQWAHRMWVAEEVWINWWQVQSKINKFHLSKNVKKLIQNWFQMNIISCWLKCLVSIVMVVENCTFDLWNQYYISHDFFFKVRPLREVNFGHLVILSVPFRRLLMPKHNITWKCWLFWYIYLFSLCLLISLKITGP